MIKIFIDPGHGAKSVGASYKGRLEQDDTFRLAAAIKTKLDAVSGVEVKLSRKKDENPDISDRCTAANTWGADYFLSIHRNAFSPEKAKGAEGWVISTAKKNGNTCNYAKKLVSALVSCGFADRGVKLGAPSYSDFGVNRLTKMHSCLLEVGFIDNSADNKIFDGKFDAIAENLARALCEICEVEYKPEADNSVSVDEVKRFMRVALGLDKQTADDLKFDTDSDGKITVNDARNALLKVLNE